MKGGAHVRLRLLTGVLFLVPLAVCLWLVEVLFRIIDGIVTHPVQRLIEQHSELGFGALWVARGIAVLFLLALFYAVGVVAANVFGSRLLKVVEGAIKSIPVVGGVYGGIRQMTDALGAGRGTAFRRCVLLEYPRREVWTVGFVTSEHRQLMGPARVPHLSVFVPTTPNPTAGFFLLVPEVQCRPTRLSLEEGFKVIVSAGIVVPENLAELAES
jgi:uncharacterized membrane protein